MNPWIGIQARSTSTRLPNKVLMKINDRPLIQYLVDTARAVTHSVAVLTPSDDDPIRKWCSDYGVPCYLGSENDLIRRYLGFARTFYATHIVRLTADCPFLDIAELSYMMGSCAAMQADVGTNAFSGTRTIVDGNDVEWMSLKFLEYLNEKAQSDEDREHVLKWAYENWLDIIEEKLPNGAPQWRTVIRQALWPQYLFPSEKTSIDTQEEFNNAKNILEGKHAGSNVAGES